LAGRKPFEYRGLREKRPGRAIYPYCSRKTSMKRMLNILARSEFELMLFIMGLIFFSWPLLRTADGKGVQTLYMYLFLIWTVIIGILVLVARAINRYHEHGNKD
jgi:hypothetical protein